MKRYKYFDGVFSYNIFLCFNVHARYDTFRYVPKYYAFKQ